MKYPDIAVIINQMKEEDLAFRQKLIAQNELGQNYHQGMEQLHIKHANQLDKIIQKIGYPTIDKVGTEASQSAWMIIQHAISLPEFMKKCATLLQQAVCKKQANSQNLAYLLDRIASFEGRPQTYGTAFDWDQYGKLSPCPYDDLHQVNQRRKAIGLNTLEEQTIAIRKNAVLDNQQAPNDWKDRNREIQNWKKKVGWVK